MAVDTAPCHVAQSVQKLSEGMTTRLSEINVHTWYYLSFLIALEKQCVLKWVGKEHPSPSAWWYWYGPSFIDPQLVEVKKREWTRAGNTVVVATCVHDPCLERKSAAELSLGSPKQGNCVKVNQSLGFAFSSSCAPWAHSWVSHSKSRAYLLWQKPDMSLILYILSHFWRLGGASGYCDAQTRL